MNLAVPRFSLLLKRARKRLQLTQAELAKRVQSTAPRVSAHETGRRTPSLAEVNAYERELGAQWSDTWKAVFCSRPRKKPEAAVRKKFRSYYRYVPPRDKETAYRLKGAYGRWPRFMTKLQARVSAKRNRVEILSFLQTAVNESSDESLGWSALCSLPTANPLKCATPQSSGYRHLPIVENGNERIVGDLPHPALHIRLEAFELILFPQVRVRGTDHEPYRMDALVGVRKKRRIVWIALAMNGAGHDSSQDEKREKHTGLKTLHISTEDFLKDELETILSDRILKLLHWEELKAA